MRILVADESLDLPYEDIERVLDDELYTFPYDDLVIYSGTRNTSFNKFVDKYLDKRNINGTKLLSEDDMYRKYTSTALSEYIDYCIIFVKEGGDGRSELVQDLLDEGVSLTSIDCVPLPA